MFSLDRHDVALIHELQRDSSQTLQQLAAQVGLSATPCWKRVKALEGAGVIRGYSARVDREKVGLSLAVIVEVELARHRVEEVRRFEEVVAASPEIVSCYATAGQCDYLLRVLARDVQHYEHFLQHTLFQLAAVTRVRSTVVLKEVKSDFRIPLDIHAP